MSALQFDLSLAKDKDNPQNEANLLAIGYEDGAIRICDINRRGSFYDLSIKHKTKVLQLQFAHNRQVLVSLSEDGEILVWSIKYKKLIHRLSNPMLSPVSMAFDDSNKKLVVGLHNHKVMIDSTHGNRHLLAVWNLSNGQFSSRPLDFSPLKMDYSSQNNYLLLLKEDMRISVVDAHNFLPVTHFHSGLTYMEELEMEYLERENKITLKNLDKEEEWQIRNGEAKKIREHVIEKKLRWRDKFREKRKRFFRSAKALAESLDALTTPVTSEEGFRNIVTPQVEYKRGPDPLPSIQPQPHFIPKPIDLFAENPNKQIYAEFITEGQTYRLRIRSYKKNKFIQERFSKTIILLKWMSEHQLIVGFEGGLIEVWKTDKKFRKIKRDFSVHILGTNDYLIYNQTHYFGSKDAIRKLTVDIDSRYLIGNMGRAENLKSTQQHFDLQMNRPDLVLQSLGFADSSHIRLLTQAHRRRLSMYGLEDSQLNETADYSAKVPRIGFAHTSPLLRYTEKREFRFDLQMNSRSRKMQFDRIFIHINQVPIYGLKGLQLDLTKKWTSLPVTVNLSEGKNKIEIFATTKEGQLTRRIVHDIYYLNPEKSQKPRLFVAAIGMSDFDESSARLKYAAKDARDFLSSFEEQNYFESVHPMLIQNQNLGQQGLAQIKNHFAQAGIDDQIMLFISTHGLIGSTGEYYLATKNTDFAKPESGSIAFHDLERTLDSLICRKKLLLIDACHSGDYEAEDVLPKNENPKIAVAKTNILSKGNSPVLGLANTSELVRELFNEFRTDTGTTIISSSSGLQFSYEDPRWQNGVFTYVFLHGLKSMEADENKDGQITASEIQAYVGEFVPRLTQGLQQPTFRRENLEYDFRVW